MNPLQSEDNLTKRISFITIGSLLVLSLYFISSSYSLHLKFKEKDKANQLLAIVNTLANQIDGDTYQQLNRKHPEGMGIKTADPIFLQFQKDLLFANLSNKLDGPIQLLTFDAAKKQVSLGITSSQNAQYQTEYQEFQKSMAANFNAEKGFDFYQNDNGKWISAYTPIQNSKGETVAFLKADSSYSTLKSSAFNALMKNAFISCLVVLLFIFSIRSYLAKVVHIIKEKELAEQKSEIKSRFLSTMSHEIRTPMNAVIGLTNIMLDESPRDDQKENLKTLKFSADFLLALINDVLDYSKLEADEIHFEKVDFDLHKLIRNVGQAMKVQADKKQLPLVINIAPDVPQFVVNDSVRLSQVITNLSGNAIKFTEKGRVSIDLKLVEKDSKEARIRFSISDTGIGISQDKFDSIFKSFSQADAATTRKFGGTGLGLSITKRMLELQNSEIKLASSVGKGSTFYFDLVMPIGKDQGLALKSPTLVIPDNIQFDGIQILLVEDNKINVMVALKFLKKWGFKVDVAENGQIALDKVQQTNYEMVLMDLDMPIMDGYEATAAIRALSNPDLNSIPIIALSASAVSDFRVRAIEVGMNEYVTKPFKPEELYGTLSRFVGVGQMV